METTNNQVPKKGRKKPAYRLGVALSGGGARGFAHAGALKALEEAGLKPDIIAGVSSGSVVAALYAAGHTPDDILNIFLPAKVSDFIDLNFGRGSIMKIESFMSFVKDALGDVRTFEDLKIPTYIGVTNLTTATAEEFHSGDLLPVIQSSCSIPIAFPPVRMGNSLYVDGGVLRNMPSWTLREKCETLIGVNVSPLSKMSADTPSMFDVALRTYQLMAKSNQRIDMEMCDLAINLREISHYQVFNLKEITKVFTSGYTHMRKALREAGLWKSDN